MANRYKQAQEIVSEKRRKLLKTAATTAPVIATLQSGAAFAAGSAHLCVNTAQTDPPTADTATNTDAWVRTSVKRYKFQPPGEDTGGAEWLYDFAGNGGGDGTYYRDADSNSDGQGDSVAVSAASGWKLLEPMSGETRYVVVLWDASGGGATELGAHPKLFFDGVSATPSRTPLTATCLCSVDPTKCNLP